LTSSQEIAHYAFGRTHWCSLVLLMDAQPFEQVVGASGGAAGDLDITALDDGANLMHRHNFSADNDCDLLVPVVGG
jgi:hypothetical protein